MQPRLHRQRSVDETPLPTNGDALVPARELLEVGMVQVDPRSGRLEWVNDDFCNLTGYDESELLRMKIDDLTPKDREVSNRFGLPRVSGRARAFRVQRPCRRKDGRIVDVQVNGTVIPPRSGHAPSLLASVQTIPAHSCDDVLVRPCVQSMIDAIPAHIAILDSTGKIICVNRSWCRFADENGFVWPAHGLGRNYASWRDSSSSSGELASVADGIEAVIRGARNEFRHEYDCTGPLRPAWYQAIIARFQTCSESHAIAIHHDISEVKRAERSLQELAARLMKAQDDERRRIALELHDVTAQNLFATSLNLSRLDDLAARAQAARSNAETAWSNAAAARAQSREMRELIKESTENVRESLKEMRSLSYVLHPPLLDQAGLVTALEWFADGFSKRTDILVDLTAMRDFPRLPPDIEVALYRVVQECFANIHRHAHSKTASADLRIVDGRIVLQVKDEGVGIPDDAMTRLDGGTIGLGVGISGMRQRMLQLAGELEIRSSDQGTIVTAIVPMATQEQSKC